MFLETYYEKQSFIMSKENMRFHIMISKHIAFKTNFQKFLYEKLISKFTPKPSPQYLFVQTSFWKVVFKIEFWGPFSSQAVYKNFLFKTNTSNSIFQNPYLKIIFLKTLFPKIVIKRWVLQPILSLLDALLPHLLILKVIGFLFPYPYFKNLSLVMWALMRIR